MKCLLFLFLIGCPAFAGKFKEPLAPEITEAIKSFHFRGAWVHPKIVKEFMPYLSDHENPLVVSIDLGAAAGTNRYFGAVKLIGPEHPSWESEEKEEKESFSYRWIGKLKNGMHVLQTEEWGGGSGTFMSVAVFELREATAVGEDGKPYRQLLLTIKRVHGLGDRVTPTFKINGNEVSVHVDASRGAKAHDFKLQFD
jgi:hypothetical protein